MCACTNILGMQQNSTSRGQLASHKHCCAPEITTALAHVFTEDKVCYGLRFGLKKYLNLDKEVQRGILPLHTLYSWLRNMSWCKHSAWLPLPQAWVPPSAYLICPSPRVTTLVQGCDPLCSPCNSLLAPSTLHPPTVWNRTWDVRDRASRHTVSLRIYSCHHVQSWITLKLLRWFVEVEHCPQPSPCCLWQKHGLRFISIHHEMWRSLNLL